MFLSTDGIWAAAQGEAEKINQGAPFAPLKELVDPLAVDDLRFVQQLTDRPVKVALPGPYLLTRAMWVGAFSSKVYADKQAMGDDVVGLLREELVDLRDAGAAFVQFDEPVLTEVVFSEESKRRTFM